MYSFKEPFAHFRFVMNYWKGGGPRNVYTLSNYLSQRGINTEVFAFFSLEHIPKSIRERYDFGTKTYNARITHPIGLLSLMNTLFLPSYNPKFFTVAPFLLSQVYLEPKALTTERNAIDIATSWQTLAPILKAKKNDLKKVLYFTQAHEVDFSKNAFYRKMAKRTYESKVQRFTQSKWLASYLDETYGGNTEYIGLGVDHNCFKPSGKQKRQVIATIVRRDQNKGFNVFLESINILWKTRNDFSVLLIGEDPKFLSDKIQFPYKYLGWIRDDSKLADIYSSSIFVNSGNNEALPMPPLEAMACGSSVVLTDIPGVKEYAVNQENCIISEPNNPKLLSSAISSLLDSDSLRNDLSRNAIATARKYNWDQTVDRLIKLLKKHEAS